MLWIFLIGTPLLVLYGIYKWLKNDAKKNESKFNWVAFTLAFIPTFLFFGFFISIYWHGTSDNFRSYDKSPSITDDDWLKDNYGGTEYYE